MAKNKQPEGEMNIPIDVGGKQGTATLRIIRDDDSQPEKPKTPKPADKEPETEPIPTPIPPPAPAKPVNVRIYLETGWFDMKADDLQKGKDLAEIIIQGGVMQTMQNQYVFHGPCRVQRVVVTP